MAAPDNPRWSTPKFFAVALGVTFAMILALNGVLNEMLHLGVPAAAIACAPTMVLILLLPRWRVFAASRAGTQK
jgi:hypothetical protein